MSNIKNQLIKRGYIPLDKSWIIRMGVLDILNDRNDIFEFLGARQEELSDDLQALLRALKSWKAGEQNIDVGESATLYRFLKFASWVLDENKRFILHGTLRKRKICDDQGIIHYSLNDLLRLDRGTSQWASAAVLLGNEEHIDRPPFKLKLTHEAVGYWKERRRNGKSWEPRYDETILRQAISFLELLKEGKTSFIPQQPEDYCFARAFGLITKEQGESLWPSLRGHESNRIEEMERIIETVNAGGMIESEDHRAIQAGTMLQKLMGRNISVKYPQCVNKSWPRYWNFLNDTSSILESL